MLSVLSFNLSSLTTLANCADPDQTPQNARRLIRVCTICLNYRKLRVEGSNRKSPFRTIFPAYTQRQSTRQCCQCFHLISLRCQHWQTVQTQIRRRRTWRLIRVCTICLNYRKLRVKGNNRKAPFRTIFPAYTQRQSTQQCCQCFDFISYRWNDRQRCVKGVLTNSLYPDWPILLLHFLATFVWLCPCSS